MGYNIGHQLPHLKKVFQEVIKEQVKKQIKHYLADKLTFIKQRQGEVPLSALAEMSQCEISECDTEFLKEALKDCEIYISMAYRASLHGWDPKEFHSRCDHIGATLSFYQVRYGPCIGGYASEEWESRYITKVDKKAFLFNLKT